MSKTFQVYSILFLFVFVAVLSIAAIPQVTYQKIRDDFKQELFYRQQGIMGQEGYNAFIEPYIQDAEKSLIVPQYLMKNPKSSVCQKYFNCLLNYNVAFFNAYAKTYPQARADVAAYEQSLRESIELIKQEGQLMELDVKQELEKTKALFDKANRRYYKKLGIVIRVYNFFRTLGK